MSLRPASPTASGDPLLRIYAWYRFALSVLLLISYSVFSSARNATHFLPLLYLGTAIPYAVLNLLTLVVVLVRPRHHRPRHLFLILAIDIAALVLITHASGGINSGFAVLLMVTVAAAAIFVTGQIATLVAAVASLAVLAEALILIIVHDGSSGTLLPAGLLGMLLFASSLLIQRLAVRLRHSQQLAHEKTAEVTELEQLNQLIVQRMRTGLLFLDTDDHIRIANESALHLLGITAHTDDIAGGNAQQLLPPQVQQALQHWREDPQHVGAPLQLRENGPLVLLSFTRLQGPNGNGTLTFVEDFSQITQQAQQLKLASLGRLTASIAHEIRNPLGSISHAGQLLRESTRLSPEDGRLVEIVLGNAQRTNQVIESVLTLSRGQLPNPELIVLDEWLRHFVNEFPQHVADTSIRIELRESGNGIEVRVDPTHLRQVMTNVCENGLRYSRRSTGEATLDIALHTDPRNGLAYMDVIDQGAGVAPEMIGSIFEPFFTTEHGGTGLGLYLAAQLCEANRIRLEYLNTAETGSCFRLNFGHPRRRSVVDVKTREQPRPDRQMT